MQLTGPSRVPDIGSITVTASGFGNAYSVKFDVAGVSGNVGFDIKETRGNASVSFTTSMSFAGGERIDAVAQDEFGAAIGKASHSFTVTAAESRPRDTGHRRRHDDIENADASRRPPADTGHRRRHGDMRSGRASQGGRYGQDDDGTGNGGGYVIDVEAPSRTEVNAEWRYRIRGLRDMHSVLIELYGANGGMFRLFPRGRDFMDHAIIPQAAGATTVVIVGRDAYLQPLATICGEIQVVQAGAVGGALQGPGAGGGYVTNFAPIPPMGLNKPPIALSAKTAAEAAQATFGRAASSMAGSGASSLDALIEAKKAELLAHLGKK